ncbi:MAG: site-specific integrase [Muribaculaceae bacterium]|nr:site-specific integrase [Muribaculaceae bacterium]
MATSKLFLDNRRTKGDDAAPLKLAIRNNRTTTFISIGISVQPSYWDKDNLKVLNTHPMCKALNARIARFKGEVDLQLMDIVDKGGSKKLTAIEIKHKVLTVLRPEDYEDSKTGFIDCFKKFIGTKKGNTKEIYSLTLSKILAYSNDENISYDDITIDWLHRFDAYMAETSPSKNARNIHMRNIRAVFNYAIDNEYTTAYPFRRFKIHAEETRKRSLLVEELREIFEYPVEDYAVIYRDMFKLIFMLIGINVVDLHRLTKIKRGRIEYRRAKTGRLYSIKVEPEAMKLIEKYKGDKGLLVIADRWTDHKNFRHQINKALQRFGKVERVGQGGKKIVTPEWPELTTYWARHTWATIAAELDIPDAVISEALGHSSEHHNTTEIYIRRNQKKVDEANRKVLDWVLYGKR